MLYYAVYEYFAIEGLGSLLDKVNTMSQDISTIPNIYFDVYTLEVVKDFAYLSFIISSNLSLKADPNPQIFNAVTMTSLNKWVWDITMLSISTKMKMCLCTQQVALWQWDMDPVFPTRTQTQCLPSVVPEGVWASLGKTASNMNVLETQEYQTHSSCFLKDACIGQAMLAAFKATKYNTVWRTCH